MWNTFISDNCLDEKIIFGNRINWKDCVDEINIKFELINTMNFMLNDDLNISLKKMISYVIIGAFAYVVPDIKSLYSDVIFS